MSDGWVPDPAEGERPLSGLLYGASVLFGAALGVCSMLLWSSLTPAPALLWSPLLVLLFFIPGVALAVTYIVLRDRRELRRMRDRGERRYPFRFGVAPTALPPEYPNQGRP